jgi:GDPmannose 4,6-dehydratase
VQTLLGDASKARAALGWRPTITFAELIAEMMEADLAKLASPERSRRSPGD